MKRKSNSSEQSQGSKLSEQSEGQALNTKKRVLESEQPSNYKYYTMTWVSGNYVPTAMNFTQFSYLG